MLDVLNKVKEAEDQAQNQITRAVQEAAAAKADAQKQGKALLEMQKQKATKQGQELILQAQKQAEEMLKTADAASLEESEKLLSTAQQKLPQAANLIVERIVNTL